MLLRMGDFLCPDSDATNPEKKMVGGTQRLIPVNNQFCTNLVKA
jgi:hypothetical protein